MRREISSPVTILKKISVLAIFGIMIPVFFLSGMDVFSLKTLILAAVYVTTGVLAIRHTLDLKKVEMIETGLFISQINFGKDSEIFVPFEEIANVSPVFSLGGGGYLIVEFKGLTKFGTRISFKPADRSSNVYEHPIIMELNGKAQNARFQAQIERHNS